MKYVLGWILSGISITLHWNQSGRLMEKPNCMLAQCRCWRASTLCCITQNTPLWHYALKGNLAPLDFSFKMRAGRELLQPPGEGQSADAGFKPQGCPAWEWSTLHACTHAVIFFSVAVSHRKKGGEMKYFLQLAPILTHWENTVERTSQTPKGEARTEFYPDLRHLRFYIRH